MNIQQNSTITMPNWKKNHDENRKKVCAVCFDKNKTVRPISDDQENIIQSTIPGFRLTSKRFPSAICTTCRIYIIKYRESFTNHVKVFDYQKHRFAYERGGVECSCVICSVARLKLNKRNIYSTKNDKSTLLDESKLCMKCFTTIGRGKPHNCAAATRRRNLKIIAENEGLEVSGKVRNTRVTLDDMIRIRARLNLSMNEVKILSYELRHCNKNYNRAAVEPNLMNQMQKSSHRLDSYFKSEIDSGKVYIYCLDVCSLVNHIIHLRNNDVNDVHIKIGMDSGAGTFKITLNIVLKENSQDRRLDRFKNSGVKKLIVLSVCTSTKEDYASAKKMWTMSNLDALLNNFQCTVHADLKLIMIITGLMSCSSKCPCPYCDTSDINEKDTSRTVENITQNNAAWLKSGASKKTQSTSKYKCCTNTPVFDISDKKTEIINICPPPELHLLLGAVNRIYNDLKKNHPTTAKEFVARLGFSKCSQFGFNGKQSRKMCKKYSILCNVISDHTANGTYIENMDTDTGANDDSEEDLSEDEDEIEDSDDDDALGNDDTMEPTPNEITSSNKYVNALRSLDKVVHSCFGNMLAVHEFEGNIREFSLAYLQLNIKHTVKTHIITQHVINFCNSKNKSLGFYSEQSSESVHYDFASHWELYKIDSANSMLEKNLLRAVCSYNTDHI